MKDIDRIMAEKVMGWVLLSTADTWTDKSEDWWCNKEKYEAGAKSINTIGITRAGCWRPSTDNEQAMMCLLKLIGKEDPKEYPAYFYELRDCGILHTCIIIKEHRMDTETFEVTANTPSKAITEAIRKAVEDGTGGRDGSK